MTENQNLHAADPFYSTRRYFLGRGMGLSLGAIACQLLGDGGGLSSAAAAQAVDAGSSAPAAGGLAGLPHFTPRAKRVIFLTQSGGPSQLELYDHKPQLEAWAGKELPESVRQGQRLTTMTANQKALPMLPALKRFERYGECGRMLSPFL
ncbi:MAG: DUF1501 domain-containing protein, partial [Planctomycetaceae bacterium]|nr:DUF1501 domain-containing protein [Planctomycetaceae bacterium]